MSDPAILLTAATPWESRPLTRALGLGPDPAGRGLFRGECGGRALMLIQTGMGPQKTRAALATLDGAERVGTVISTGFAGGLDPALGPGDIILDAGDAPEALVADAARVADEAGLTLHVGTVVSEDRVVADPAAKRALGERTRAAAVDMESAEVRAWARSRSADFLVLRSVLDAAHDRLPSAVPAGEGAAALLGFALGNWRELPLLLLLADRKRRAVRALEVYLGRFLEEMVKKGGT